MNEVTTTIKFIEYIVQGGWIFTAIFLAILILLYKIYSSKIDTVLAIEKLSNLINVLSSTISFIKDDLTSKTKELNASVKSQGILLEEHEAKIKKFIKKFDDLDCVKAEKSIKNNAIKNKIKNK